MNTVGGPRCIIPGSVPWPLHSMAATRAAEALAQAQQPAGALMARAGLAVARLALALAPHARHVNVFAGPGNNGGDGLVAARHLHAAGKRVHVSLLGDPARLPPDAASAWRQAADAGVMLHTWAGCISASPPGGHLMIDALLGLGASRAVSGEMAQAITAISRHGTTVLSVDIPSGLNSDTGAALGGPVVRAQHTLSLLTLKPGCFTAEGRDHAGQVWLDTLDTPCGAATAWLSAKARPPPRRHTLHKGDLGDVVVVGGATGMVGAAWLAARAALAAGAGRVFVSLLDNAAATCDLQRPELMLRPGWWRSAPARLAQTTVVCGCGAGDRLGEVLPPLIAHAARLVLDADALNAVAADASLQASLRHRQARGRATVLTPHPLEAARLLGCSTAQVQQDRLAAAQSLAEQLSATVLLKGSGSVLAAVGATPQINGTGNGVLASPGTGDVLAGWIGGLWAQYSAADALAIAGEAAWLHGDAADRFAGHGDHGPLRAAELVEWMAGPHGARA